MNRYLPLCGGILMQTCIGGIYAWSTFVPPLQAEGGLTTLHTQLLFGGCILAFTTTMILAGRILHRVGPRRMACFGGLFYGVGLLVAGASGGTFPLLILGIVILSGIGIGCVYVCPIVVAMKWFPQSRGLVTGLSVAGFGGGAVLLSNVADMLMRHAVPVFRVLQVMGVGYMILIGLAACALRIPAGTSLAPGVQPGAPAGRKASREWVVFFLGIFCGTFAGLMVIGNLEPIGLLLGHSHRHSLAAISIFAVGNAMGRITWGWLFDRFRLRAIPAALFLIALSTLLLLMLGTHPTAFVTGSWLAGFCFGACFVIFAGAVAHRFGTEHVARLYPRIFLGYGIAGLVGPGVAGILFDATHSYAIALWIAVALPFLAGVGFLLYHARVRDTQDGIPSA